MRLWVPPRFYQEGKHWYAQDDNVRLRWKVVGIVGVYPPMFRVEKLR